MPFVTCDGHYLVRGGRRFFPIGINYLPSYLCGNYFADYRVEHIRADLDHMRELGLNSIRVPVFWAGFEPEAGKYSEDYLRVFRSFVEECRARELLVMPVFLIGTWTGMYDAPYWKAPGMYQGEMLEMEARHVAAFARSFADDDAILCWDLSDEPYYLEEIPPSPPRTAAGRPPARRDIATQWVARLAAAIREVDPNHLITLGFDPHPVRSDSGFALEEVAEHLDMMSYCIYPWPLTRGEVELVAYGAFQTRFFAAGRPAFLHEGPGISSSVASERVLADRFRAWLYTSLANGNLGVLPWNYTDYEEEQHYRWPLDASPLEPNFGICNVDRSLKPRGREFVRFAADVRRLPLDELALEPPRAALIYPHGYYERAGRLHDKLWRHFTLAKGANLNLDLVREDRLTGVIGRGHGHARPTAACLRLLIVPGVSLRLSTWAKLRDFVSAGGYLLAVMDDLTILSPMFASLFGVTVEGYRPGVAAAALDRPWGGSPEGEVLSFGRSADRLWASPGKAEAIASFDDGYPFFTANAFGQGKAFLATIPFPRLLDLSDPREATCRAALSLFRGLRDMSGCAPPVDADLPWVETALFRAAAGRIDWALLINYDNVSADGTATIRGDYAGVLDDEGRALPVERASGDLRVPIHLGPNGALLWRLTGDSLAPRR